MTHSLDDIETSYRFCRQTCRWAGSNFHAGFRLLPREKRRAMEALYAFMRHTDDLADDTTGPRHAALAAWRAGLEQAMESERSSVQRSAIGDQPCLPALADTVRRFHIPVEYLRDVIDGVEMDLDGRRYETFEELEPYCLRVASAVGLACIHIWGFRGPEAFAPARKAGVAMQLTNILRDLKEDAAAGRVYLPLADLRECDYSVDDLMAGVVDVRFRRLMANQAARAERFYAEGTELIDWLEPSGQRIFGLMMATYRSLLRKIARHPADVFHRRVRLGRVQKARLALRWALLPPRKDSLR